MKKKLFPIALILLVCILGLLTIGSISFGMNFMAHIEGYKGYCSSVKLPMIVDVIVTEITLTILICCFYIYTSFYEVTRRILKRIVFASIFNLLFIAYHVIQFPILMKVASSWGSRMTDVSMLEHPLLYLSFIYSIVLLLLNYKIGKGTSDKIFTQTINFIIFLLMVLIILARLTTSYQHCYG